MERRRRNGLLLSIGAAVIPLITVAATVWWSPWLGLAFGLLLGFSLAAVRAVIADDEKDRAVEVATEAERQAGDERADGAQRGDDSARRSTQSYYESQVEQASGAGQQEREEHTKTKLELEAAREEIGNLKLDVKVLEDELLKSNGGWEGATSPRSSPQIVHVAAHVAERTAQPGGIAQMADGAGRSRESAARRVLPLGNASAMDDNISTDLGPLHLELEVVTASGRVGRLTVDPPTTMTADGPLALPMRGP